MNDVYRVTPKNRPSNVYKYPKVYTSPPSQSKNILSAEEQSRDAVSPTINRRSARFGSTQLNEFRGWFGKVMVNVALKDPYEKDLEVDWDD